LSVLNLLVLASPVFLFIVVLNIIVSSLAIWVIWNSSGALFGIRLAKVSLGWSIVTLVAVATFQPYYHHTMLQNADKFAKSWFAAVKADDIPLAFEMRRPFWIRNLPEDPLEWWHAQIFDDQMTHEFLHRHLNNQVLRTLVHLGDRADVSFYRLNSWNTHDSIHYLSLVYAVTYPNEQGDKETFFVEILLQLHYHHQDRSAGWLLQQFPEHPLSLETVKNPEQSRNF